MATTLANLNTLINDRRRDTGSGSIDMTGDGFRAINSALDTWNQMHDWEFQIEEALVTYNEGITYYAVPTAFKAPIDLRYYKGSRRQEFAMVSEANFDSEALKTRRFAVSTTGQTERLRIKATGDKAQISPLGSTTEGTWTAGSAVSGLTTDSYEFFELNSSVTFAYSGTSGTVTIALPDTLDISRFKNRSNFYFNFLSSSWTNFTSITIKIGSDASNYYTASATTNYLGATPTANQWEKFKVAWSSFSTVGTPVDTAIDYIQFTIAFSVDPAATMWVENLFVSENVPLLFEYYSTNMVTTTSGTKTQNFTNSSNTTDTPLFTGKWDYVRESFINSVLETVFWITGEYDDRNISTVKIQEIVNNLKVRMPTRRRYPEMSFRFDID